MRSRSEVALSLPPLGLKTPCDTKDYVVAPTRPAFLIVEPRLAIALELTEQIGRLGHHVAGPFGNVAEPRKLLERPSVRITGAALNPTVADIEVLAKALDERLVPLIYLDEDQSRRPELPEGLWLPRTDRGTFVWLAKMSVNDLFPPNRRRVCNAS